MRQRVLPYFRPLEILQSYKTIKLALGICLRISRLLRSMFRLFCVLVSNPIRKLILTFFTCVYNVQSGLTPDVIYRRANWRYCIRASHESRPLSGEGSAKSRDHYSVPNLRRKSARQKLTASS